MLFEWYESGIDIQLHSPQPNVEQNAVVPDVLQRLRRWSFRTV